MITRRDIDYLRGIVRKEIRWREDILEHFKTRDDQTPEEAEDVRERIERLLAHDRKVLGKLDTLSLRARELAEKDTAV